MLRWPKTVLRTGPHGARIASLALVSIAFGWLLFGAGASPAAAMSLAEYRSALREIRDEAASLGESTPDRAIEIATTVETVLPEGETVNLAGARIPVRDPELMELAERLSEAKTASGIRLTAERVEDRSSALLDAIGTGQINDIREDQEALDRILAVEDASEGDTLGERFLEIVEKVVDWILDQLSGLPGVNVPDAPDVDLTGAWPYVVGVAAAVGAGLLVRLVMWVVSRRRLRHDEPVDEDTSPVVAAAEDLPPDVLAHVEKLASAGRFREAVRALFGGAARTLVDAGVIARTKTRTNGELLGDVAVTAPALAGDLGALARIFENAWYGRRDPERAGFDRALGHYTAVVDTAGRWRGGDE